jgi:capsid portal protein
MFRKLYYDNGSHAGCIVYIGAGQVDDKSMKAVKETLTGARGKGAFKNLLLHAPGGGKDGVQILPSSRSRRKMSLSTLRTPRVTTYSQRTVSRRS